MYLAICLLVAFSSCRVQAKGPLKCPYCVSLMDNPEKDCDSKVKTQLCTPEEEKCMAYEKSLQKIHDDCKPDGALKGNCRVSTCTESGCLAEFAPLECPYCISFVENPKSDCDRNVKTQICTAEGANCIAYEQTGEYGPYFERGCVDEKSLQRYVEDCKPDGVLEGNCRVATCAESGCMAKFEKDNE